MRFISKAPISFLVCLLFAVVFFWVSMNTSKWRNCSLLQWDAAGYYHYLSGSFIGNDLLELTSYDKIDNAYHPTGEIKRYGIHQALITNQAVIKYTIGTAIFELPFFGLAYAYCSLTGKHPLDGYSIPFQFSIALSAILFVVLALFILRGFLLNYFEDKNIAIALVAIGLGTNLFYYTAIAQGMSHVFGFFCFACVLFLTDRWYRNPNYKDSILLGLCLGLAAILRPTNLIILFFPLGYMLLNRNEMILLWRRNLSKIGLVLIIAFLVGMIQLFYWKLSSGHWLYYSYQDEGFEFAKSQIGNGLFSYRKGWFVYTPLALLGFIGIITTYRDIRLRFYMVPFLMFFALSIYVFFSWRMWYYGGSFGCRVLIESLAILAFPICSLAKFVCSKREQFVKWIFAIILFLGIGLNLFQSWQYHNAIIHWDSMNKGYYWRIFGKTSVSEEDRQLLNQ